jgi:quinol monooxygenase YgiN
MIIRIVKMQFHPEKVDTFLDVFHNSADQIRNFSGCQHLELYKHESTPGLLFTYSYWQDAESLENYRKSELFQTTWAKTNILFSAKAEAWSLIRIWNASRPEIIE